jgi:hypothetical protein
LQSQVLEREADDPDAAALDWFAGLFNTNAKLGAIAIGSYRDADAYETKLRTLRDNVLLAAREWRPRNLSKGEFLRELRLRLLKREAHWQQVAQRYARESEASTRAQRNEMGGERTGTESPGRFDDIDARLASAREALERSRRIRRATSEGVPTSIQELMPDSGQTVDAAPLSREAKGLAGTEPAQENSNRPESDARRISPERPLACDATSREARLQSFKTQHRATYADIQHSASVHKPDFQKWRAGELKAESVMTERIEAVLQGARPFVRKPPKRRVQ